MPSMVLRGGNLVLRGGNALIDGRGLECCCAPSECPSIVVGSTMRITGVIRGVRKSATKYYFQGCPQNAEPDDPGCGFDCTPLLDDTCTDFDIVLIDAWNVEDQTITCTSASTVGTVTTATFSGTVMATRGLVDQAPGSGNIDCYSFDDTREYACSATFERDSSDNSGTIVVTVIDPSEESDTGFTLFNFFANETYPASWNFCVGARIAIATSDQFTEGELATPAWGFNFFYDFDNDGASGGPTVAFPGFGDESARVYIRTSPTATIGGETDCVTVSDEPGGVNFEKVSGKAQHDVVVTIHSP